MRHDQLARWYQPDAAFYVVAVPPAHIHGVVFDLDGVLIDSEPLWHRAEQDVLRAVGVPLTPAMCLETTGVRVDAVVRHWHDRYPWASPSLDDITQQIISRVTSIIGSEATPMLHAREAIAEVVARGLRLGLASSSPM